MEIATNFVFFQLLALGFCSPLWVLIAFCAYAAGRGKQFRLADLFTLVLFEAIAIVVAMACVPGLTVNRE
jgi:hypothetical protein